ncbi:MAG TPA: TIGR04255 family protein, partial [Longimicrobium sp.]|nr:TIGR04255 family protein [Longimicrobium sp.]
MRTPPITEAIIDIRADLGVGFEVSRLRAAESLLSGRYALEGEQHLFARTVDLAGDAPGTSQAESALLGYTFRSTDQRFIAQLTVEGLTVSQLRDYTRWEQLAEETAKVWDVYARVASPQTVLRVGTRYLNRIPIPLPTEEFEEYFNTLPRVPAGVPELVTNLLVRMLLHDKDPPFSVSITQYLDESSAGSSRMILDIDAFSREAYNADGAGMWDALAGLRDLKNRVFFGSLTEKA